MSKHTKVDEPKIVAGIYSFHRGKGKVTMVNTTAKKQHLPEDEFVGIMENLVDQYNVTPWKPSDGKARIKDDRAEWNDKDYKQQLYNFL